MFGVSTNLRACRKSATGWCMAACQTKAVANAIINKIFDLKYIIVHRKYFLIDKMVCFMQPNDTIAQENSLLLNT